MQWKKTNILRIDIDAIDDTFFLGPFALFLPFPIVFGLAQLNYCKITRKNNTRRLKGTKPPLNSSS